MAEKWWKQAAVLWIDMERGVYPWEGKPPRHKDGSFRVIRTRILKDVGRAPQLADVARRVWNNSTFLGMLDAERRRRDCGINELVTQMEQVTGPLHETRQKVIENVKDIFARQPDAEDPLALSPQQYVKEGREWIRYIDEIEGRFEGQKAETIETILLQQSQTNRINADMMNSALELLKDHRRQQDDRFAMMGVLDSTAEEVDE
jgi:hypothetical protein